MTTAEPTHQSTRHHSPRVVACSAGPPSPVSPCSLSASEPSPPRSSPEAGAATATQIRHYAADNAVTIRPTLSPRSSVSGSSSLRGRPSATGPRGPAALDHAQYPRRLQRSHRAQTLYADRGDVDLRTVRPAAEVSDTTLVTMYDVAAIAQWLYTLTVAAPCMFLVATYSWLALRHRLMARWISWAGFAIAVAGATTIVGLTLPDRRSTSSPSCCSAGGCGPSQSAARSASAGCGRGDEIERVSAQHERALRLQISSHWVVEDGRALPDARHHDSLTVDSTSGRLPPESAGRVVAR